eukprot:IDg2912t1
MRFAPAASADVREMGHAVRFAASCGNVACHLHQGMLLRTADSVARAYSIDRRCVAWPLSSAKNLCHLTDCSAFHCIIIVCDWLHVYRRACPRTSTTYWLASSILFSQKRVFIGLNDTFLSMLPSRPFIISHLTFCERLAGLVRLHSGRQNLSPGAKL